MNSSIKIQSSAILLIICAQIQNCVGQDDKFQLKLTEIFTDTVQLKALGDSKYELRISQPDSQRVETIAVEPTDAGEVVVVNKGEILTKYPNENLNLVMNYVADGHGFRASYRLAKEIDNDDDIFFEPRLSVKDLKTLTG